MVNEPEIHAPRVDAEAIRLVTVVLELENPRFAETLRQPTWSNDGSVAFTYAGINDRGLELRVGYFRGARLKRTVT